jgi:hypothetical protein
MGAFVLSSLLVGIGTRTAGRSLRREDVGFEHSSVRGESLYLSHLE